jgi:hypothetical protein
VQLARAIEHRGTLPLVTPMSGQNWGSHLTIDQAITDDVLPPGATQLKELATCRLGPVRREEGRHRTLVPRLTGSPTRHAESPLGGQALAQLLRVRVARAGSARPVKVVDELYQDFLCHSATPYAPHQ